MNMKMIARTINGFDILVNPYSPNEILMETKHYKESYTGNLNLSPEELCEILADGKFVPLILTWELTDKCNFKCPFCYIVNTSSSPTIRFSTIKSSLDKLIKMGLLYCVLTGGEATIHPDFKKIYCYLKKKGVIVEVYTNGSLITDEIIQMFKKYPPYKVEISIYGISQLNFEIVTNTKKIMFDNILENILKLKKNDINIKCKTPLNKLTYKEFEKIRNWCDEFKISHYFSVNVINSYIGKNMKSYEVDIETLIEYEVKRLKAINYNQHSLLNFPRNKKCFTCGVRNTGLHINDSFYITPCQDSRLNEASFDILSLGIDRAIYQCREFVNSFKEQLILGCTGCDVSFFCDMCYAKALPIRNEKDQITQFCVPENFCKNTKKRIKETLNKYMQ